MEKILEQYFIQKNELVFTNIGTIHLTKKPASWIGEILHAPELSILFTTVKKKPSNQFFTYIAEALSVSPEQANIQYEQFLQKSFEKQEATITIGNLGSIEKKGDEYFWKNNFTSNQYYKDITISPIEENEQAKNNLSIKWYWMAIVFALIAMAAILFKSL